MFEPFQKVLVRDYESQKWRASFFSHRDDDCDLPPYFSISGRYTYCIPYEGNEHLIGTNAKPVPKFKPRKGQLVAVRDNPKQDWTVYKYADYYDNRYWCVANDEDVDNEGNHVSWVYCEPLKNHFDIGE